MSCHTVSRTDCHTERLGQHAHSRLPSHTHDSAAHLRLLNLDPCQQMTVTRHALNSNSNLSSGEPHVLKWHNWQFSSRKQFIKVLWQLHPIFQAKMGMHLIISCWMLKGKLRLTLPFNWWFGLASKIFANSGATCIVAASGLLLQLGNFWILVFFFKFCTKTGSDPLCELQTFSSCLFMGREPSDGGVQCWTAQVQGSSVCTGWVGHWNHSTSGAF